MKKLLLIIFILPIFSHSQTIEFDTTCFCSNIVVKANEHGIYNIESWPVYPGGDNDSFKEFIKDNTSLQETDNSKVLIYFTINCEGNTCGHNIKLLEGSISDVSLQGILLSLNKMQKWQPGKQRNKIIDVRYSRFIEIINGRIE